VTTDQFEEIAALYAAGALSEEERRTFQAEMAARPEWASDMARLSDVGAAVAVALTLDKHKPPRPSQRDKLLASVKNRMPSIVERLFGISPEEAATRPVTVTDGRELVRWVSPAFLEMCGYALEELLGRKIGEVLRGPLTDPEAVGRLRDGIRKRHPVREQLVNYHKNGGAYVVDINITPVPGECVESQCFVARETKVRDLAEESPVRP
jgi:PAS domain S-box-containing protein